MEKRASATITRKIDWTTLRVVWRPTASAPPLVRKPWKQPTTAMMTAKTGALQILLADFEGAPLPVHVVHHEGRRATQKVRSFVDLTVETLRADPALNRQCQAIGVSRFASTVKT